MGEHRGVRVQLSHRRGVRPTLLKVGSAVAAVPDMTRVHVSKVDGHVTRVVSRVRRERVPMSELEGEEEAEFVELDLEKTLTWTGNAVTIQAGGEFRLPLIVPHPSVLAIQFEIEGGYDIEFSLNFQDDHEEGSSVVRTDEAGSLGTRRF